MPLARQADVWCLPGPSSAADVAADGQKAVRCRAAIQLEGEMEQAFAGIHIPSTVAFDYPNIRPDHTYENAHGDVATELESSAFAQVAVKLDSG